MDKLFAMLFNNWKTTMIGLVDGAAVLLNEHDVFVGSDLKGRVTAYLIGIGVMLFGLVSKDAEPPKTEGVFGRD